MRCACMQYSTVRCAALLIVLIWAKLHCNVFHCCILACVRLGYKRSGERAWGDVARAIRRQQGPAIKPSHYMN